MAKPKQVRHSMNLKDCMLFLERCEHDTKVYGRIWYSKYKEYACNDHLGMAARELGFNEYIEKPGKKGGAQRYALAGSPTRFMAEALMEKGREVSRRCNKIDPDKKRNAPIQNHGTYTVDPVTPSQEIEIEIPQIPIPPVIPVSVAEDDPQKVITLLQTLAGQNAVIIQLLAEQLQVWKRP